MKKIRNLFKMSENKEIIWIYAAAVLFFIILILVIMKSTGGKLTPYLSEGYGNLTIARTWVNGHPLKINPGEPRTTASPDYLYPLFLSAGNFIGFSGKYGTVLWMFLFNFILFMGAAYFLWRITKEYFPSARKSITLISILFAPIFSNFFAGTNFPLFFFSFMGAIAFLNSLPLFLTFSILSGLSRPEGIIVYLVLSSIYYFSPGKKKVYPLIAGVLPLFIPLLINYLINGDILPQGVVPLSLFKYTGFTAAIKTGMATFLDQIKSSILAYYSTSQDIGMSQGGSFFYFLPPLLIPVFIWGIFKSEKKWLYLPLIIYTLILLLGDSFTIYAGTHYSRHVIVVYPFIFAFALDGVRNIKIKNKAIFPYLIIFFSIFIISQELILFSDISERSRIRAKAKKMAEWVKNNTEKGTSILSGQTPYETDFWIDNRKIVSISPAINPHFGRWIKYYFRTTEQTELIQRFYRDIDYILIDVNKISPTDNWLLSFSSGYKKYYEFAGKKMVIQKVNLNQLKDPPPYPAPLDELDVGDPISEKNHDYVALKSSDSRYQRPLYVESNFCDGGRLITKKERFKIFLPPENLTLICRYRGEFNGFKPGLKREEIKVDLKENPYTVKLDGKTINKGVLNPKTGFFYLTIQLTGKNRYSTVEIEGNYVSFHYWLYNKNM